MKLRTTIQLSAFLQEELGWRRKELSIYRGLVSSAGQQNLQPILRGAITVLYAHWEGYVKAAGQSYLEYVSQQRLKCKELSLGFLAIAAKRKLHEASESGRSHSHRKMVEFFLNDLDERAFIPSDIVNTKANLSVSVFQDIITLLDLEYRTEYSVAEKPIIERLLELRNDVAHGQFQVLSEVEYNQLHDHISNMLVLLCNDIDNAASGKRYKRT